MVISRAINKKAGGLDIGGEVTEDLTHSVYIIFQLQIALLVAEIIL